MKEDNIIQFPTEEERRQRELDEMLDQTEVLIENDDDEISIAQSFCSAAMVQTVYALEREGYEIDEQLEDDVMTVFNFLYAAVLRSIGHTHYMTDELDQATHNMSELLEYLKQLEETDNDTT